MTLAQIVEADSGTLAKITDEEYLKIFADALNVTRPEFASLRRNDPSKAYIAPAKKMALNALAASGFDMSLLIPSKKKK